MNNQLRPMTLGEILDRTAELYRNHFLLFAGTSGIFAGTILAIDLLHLGTLTLLGYPHVPPRLEWAYAVSLGIQVLAISLVLGLSIAAFNRVVAWIYLSEPATIRKAAGSVLSRIGQYLWLMAVMMFRAWTPLFAAYVGMFALFFSIMPRGFLFNPQIVQQAPAPDAGAMIAAGVGMLILLLLFFGALVYGVFMWLRYSLAMPACVVEGLKMGPSLRRSIDLSQGSRGRIFLLWLLVYVVRLVLGVLVGFPLIVFGFKHPGQALPLGWLALSQVGGVVVNALIGPIYSTGLTLFYYDLRIRKEGFDIEWMMQAAGMVPQQTLAGFAGKPGGVAEQAGAATSVQSGDGSAESLGV